MKYRVEEATASAVVLSDSKVLDQWCRPTKMTLAFAGAVDSFVPGSWVELVLRPTTAPSDDVPKQS